MVEGRVGKDYQLWGSVVTEVHPHGTPHNCDIHVVVVAAVVWPSHPGRWWWIASLLEELLGDNKTYCCRLVCSTQPALIRGVCAAVVVCVRETEETIVHVCTTSVFCFVASRVEMCALAKHPVVDKAARCCFQGHI